MTLEDQFSQMVKENEAIIFKVSTVYTRTLEDQQDLYQEIVIQLWRAFGTFRQQARISTWIYRIALNTAITRLRREKRQTQHVPIDQVVLRYAEGTDPVFEEQVKMLYRYIETLNDLDKGIILLYLEEKSHEEIAGIIGISKSNVGTRISRIRQKMKAQLTQDQ
ncbi:RNA polymerase sigma factor [Flavilitoribacter nigricans]|uniref:RNA polymerase subunit sigma-70 n=1 Tax=Flavilitoribacter nigricans (strain ATCC 23147 / DSM 23189 / NBRC 102662 / NCIMB 1420 / SS-2) TaxID=1122177 RepID=A0A2D0MXL1_FLAN2|nr:sigma-70 family RNA polymerase sigma factor [Flavilitoribacter nigricans]PHN00866.1 RNA polymerase subunit sigma-70 [Flavilitoribacter nigricans DSM 23189 = NBRC 102662]